MLPVINVSIADQPVDVLKPKGVMKINTPSRGCIQIYTGDGKGKTTAALGLLLRAIGAQKRVAIIFFDKGGTHYCERKTLQTFLKDQVDFFVTGRDRIDPQTGQFDFSLIQEDQEEARRGLLKVKDLFKEAQHDIIILDEINSSTHLGFISEQEVLELLLEKPVSLELILTGRHAPVSFLQKADLVTEMRCHKHYFYSGVCAREGIDF
jgi:cob(I)alamin adenosyltransferase